MPYTYAGEYADGQFDTSGRPLKSKSVSVLLPDGVTLATLYTSRTKTAVAPNPLVTDSYGNLKFFADPGVYRLFATGGPLGGVEQVVHPDPAEASGGGGAPTGAAGGSLAGTYPNPSIAAGAVSAAEVAAANKDGVAGTPSMRTLGSGAQQAAAGNDARLSDQRTPVDGSVTTAKIADGAVTAAKVAADVATQAELDAEAAARAAADALLVPLTQKGAASGVASLDSGGKVPAGQLPAITISDFLGTVVSQAAMLALSGQRGDWAIRSDTSATWMLIGDDATQLANWKQLATPPDAVLSVQGLTGVVVLPADDVPGVASLRTLGTGAQQATPGTHPASSDHPNLGNGTPTSSTPGDSGTAGVGGTTARADHRHGRADSYAAANPQALGAAAPGTAATVSRGDHVHPTTGMALSTDVTAEAAARAAADALLAPIASPTFTGTLIVPAAEITGKNGLSTRRFAGRKTTTGAPTTGAWLVDDEVIDSGGIIWRCTVAGSPGTWVQVTPSATSGTGLPSTIVSKTANYTAAGGEYVQADATAGGFTITLPANPAAGTLVAVKKIDASANTVTIAPAGGGTIDGDANATTTTRWAGAIFEHIASNVWAVAASMSTTGPAGPTGPTGATGATGSTGATGAAGQGFGVAETVNTQAAVTGTYTIPDISTATMHRLTLTGNTTLTFPTAAAGKSFAVALVQDATGSRTITWPGTVKWAAATAPTLTTTAARVDLLSFTCFDGTNWLGVVGGQNFS